MYDEFSCRVGCIFDIDLASIGECGISDIATQSFRPGFNNEVGHDIKQFTEGVFGQKSLDMDSQVGLFCNFVAGDISP